MSNKEEMKKEPEKKVPPEKERTFLYTLLRVIAWIGSHTIFPVKYYHKERYAIKAPYITMSNHQSACDPIILAYPCKKYEVRFVGKKELNLNKFVEKLLAKLHMITVDRHNPIWRPCACAPKPCGTAMFWAFSRRARGTTRT